MAGLVEEVLDRSQGVVDLMRHLLALTVEAARNDGPSVALLAEGEDLIWARWRSDLVVWLEDVFGHSAPSTLPGEVVARWVDQHPPPVERDAICARQIALAFDQVYGDQLLTLVSAWYARREGWDPDEPSGHHPALVGFGDPLPVCSTQRDQVRSPRRSRPEAGPNGHRPGRLPHFSIRADGYAVRMVVDFRLMSFLGEEDGPTMGVAVGLPTTLDDFPRSSAVPFPYHPKHPDGIADIMAEQLDRLAGTSARLVVFPELVTTLDTRERLLKHWAAGQPASSVRAMVPGSVHVQRDSERLNVAALYHREGVEVDAVVPSFAHLKFSPPVRTHQSREYLYEPLTPQVCQIRVHVSRAAMVAVVVCKDLIELDVMEALRESNTDIVLVPALTPSDDMMRGVADMLARNWLIETYIANTARRGYRSGLVGHPGFDDAVEELYLLRDERTVAVVDLHADPPIRWIQSSSPP
jgi:predicted amidohydrolase